MTDYLHISGDTTGHETLIALMTAQFEAEGGTVVDENTVFDEDSHSDDLASALDDDTLWRRYDEFDVCHITTDGDLVFDIRDAFAPAGFGSGDLLHYWAKLHGFDLHGWDYATLYWKMLQATLFPAILELPDGQVLMDAHNAVQHGSDVPKLPELRIVVNGTVLMEYFVVCLDGPFRDDAAFDKALERRKRCFRPAAKRH